MVVRKLKVFPVEAIVRGYITGSAWAEYSKSGTVNGIKVKDGMVESEAFDAPLFTPSTKAEQGQHGEHCRLTEEDMAIKSRILTKFDGTDENIHPDKGIYSLNQSGSGKMLSHYTVKELVGEKYSARIAELAVTLYTKVCVSCVKACLVKLLIHSNRPATTP